MESDSIEIISGYNEEEEHEKESFGNCSGHCIGA